MSRVLFTCQELQMAWWRLPDARATINPPDRFVVLLAPSNTDTSSPRQHRQIVRLVHT